MGELHDDPEAPRVGTKTGPRRAWMRGHKNTLRRLHDVHRDTPRADFIAGGGPFLVTSLSLGPTALDTTLVFDLKGRDCRPGRIVITAADDEAEASQETELTRYDLGRSPECDVVIPCGSVSKRHARLAERDGLWSVVDLDSKNGTRLDGQALRPLKPFRITTTPARLDLGSDARFFFMTRADMFDFLVKVREATGEGQPVPLEPVHVAKESPPIGADSRELYGSLGQTMDDDATEEIVRHDPDLGLLAAYDTQEAEVLGEDTDERRFDLALASLEAMGDGMVQTIEASIQGSERGLVLSPGKGSTVKSAAATIRKMASVIEAFRVTLAIGGGQPIELYKKR